MKKKFGDDYRIVTAYETKALNWPEVKAEDSISLERVFHFPHEMQKRYGMQQMPDQA